MADAAIGLMAPVRKAQLLKKAIKAQRAVVAYGVHNPISAMAAENNGFKVLQVSGFGLAAAIKGVPDVGLLDPGEIITATSHIVRAVKIPVMADMDTGHGNAINAMDFAERVMLLGAAGGNIEDQVDPKCCGHLTGMRAKAVISAAEMVGKIRAIDDMRQALNPDFVINARTDAFPLHGLEEAIHRCNLYLKAGADIVFIDGIRTLDQIEEAIGQLNGPLSVNIMDGVTGVRATGVADGSITIPILAKMGVGRVSIPVASIMAEYLAQNTLAAAFNASTTGTLPGRTDLMPAFADYLSFIGLPEYQARDQQYAPENQKAGG